MGRSFRWMKIDVVSVLLSAVLLLTVFGGVAQRRASTALHPLPPHIVVDAGHGGEDGGAETADGTLEKNINLAIARPLGDWLTVLGCRVTYTRTADTMVDAEGRTLRERKVSDMRNRLNLIEQADLTVSIHQNHFSQSQYSGAQVFYGTRSPSSRAVAEAIQTAVTTALQPHNRRTVKAGEDTVFLLSRATVPIVLVECGFLSNAEEAEKLKESTYQRQLALSVAVGVMRGR